MSETSQHEVIGSKYVPHPFEWTSEDLKETYRNLCKAIVSNFPLLSQFIHTKVEGVGDTIFGRTSGWGDRSINYLYHYLY
uniref:Uncharacterized protein n=1 Tax=Cucumis melo TaxID=3656 RepID=A0A9I9E725_CUCME